MTAGALKRSGGDEMIFDTLTVFFTALLFFVGMAFSYSLGKKDKKEKKRGECEGWAGILKYDHSKKGGMRNGEE